MVSTVALLAAASPLAASVTTSPFGSLPDGQAVTAYTLTNAHGTKAQIVDFGAAVVRLQTRDNVGKLYDIALGVTNAKAQAKTPYFGNIVGRYANRIAKGRFTLDGKTYKLAINNGPNSLHGGIKGYSWRVWKATPVTRAEGPAVQFTLRDPNMTEGYPGTVDVKVVYTLTQKDALRIEYWASTTKATPINLTNHLYFNLKDAGQSDVLDHKVMIAADTYTPNDAVQIPTGKIAPVKGTGFDLRAPKPIGQDIAKVDGYDHNFVLRKGGKFGMAAKVWEGSTGRTLEVWTDQPGVQFYTANFLDGTITGWNQANYKKQHAFCLETQHYPDSPNKPNFPSTILRPGKAWYSKTEYRFGVTK